MIQLAEMYIRQGFPCLFQLLTGLYCPGCGGTRAVKYLLRGQILTSIQYHPLVVYGAVMITGGVLSHCLAKLLHRPGLKMRQYDRYVYLGIGIIVINWIVKNCLLVIWGIDLLAERL